MKQNPINKSYAVKTEISLNNELICESFYHIKKHYKLILVMPVTKRKLKEMHRVTASLCSQ